MTSFARQIVESELSGITLFALFALALFLGTFVANRVFRDMSWDQMIMSEEKTSLTSRGAMRHDLLSWYAATIFFTTLVAWYFLIAFAKMFR